MTDYNFLTDIDFEGYLENFLYQSYAITHAVRETKKGRNMHNVTWTKQRDNYYGFIKLDRTIHYITAHSLPAATKQAIKHWIPREWLRFDGTRL